MRSWRLQIIGGGGEDDLLVKAPIWHHEIEGCGDPKILADAMKHFLGAKDRNTRSRALKSSEVFVSTKRKLDLPPSTHCDSH